MVLKMNLDMLKDGGFIVVDEVIFVDCNLKKVGYEVNLFIDKFLDGYCVLFVDIFKYILEVVELFGLGKKDVLWCKNMWFFGLMLWMFSCDCDLIVSWVNIKFVNKEIIWDVNIVVFNVGYVFGEIVEFEGYVLV